MPDTPKPDRRVFLKIKLKALAAEARLLRSTPIPRDLLRQAYEHRVNVIRPAARNTLLAYAFLRGRALAQVEPKAHTRPNWPEVRRMVAHYGVRCAPDMTLTEYQALVREQSYRLESWINPEAILAPNPAAAAAPVLSEGHSAPAAASA